jgi:hypothetical protein
MKKQFETAYNLIRKLDINGCITGSYMLGYHKDWQQDLDIFCFDEQSFTALLYYMHYNPMFQVLDKLEQKKLTEYMKSNKSSLDKLGLISIKYHFNLCVPINIVYKKYHRTIFDVLANFDVSGIAKGLDIKTGKMLDLTEDKGDKIWTYNKWNKTFYEADFWSCKKLLRQFSRICKYQERGYNLTSATNKYIELVEEILKTENVYHTEKGTKYFEDNIEQFTLVLKLLKAYKKEKKISPEGLQILKTLI